MDYCSSYLRALTVKPSFILLQLLTYSTTVFPQLLSAEPFWTGNNNIIVMCHQHVQSCLTDDTIVSCTKEAVPNKGHHSICHPLSFALLFTLLTSGAKVKKPAPFGCFPSFKRGKQGF
jgi:hypothetical protein